MGIESLFGINPINTSADISSVMNYDQQLKYLSSLLLGQQQPQIFANPIAAGLMGAAAAMPGGGGVEQINKLAERDAAANAANLRSRLAGIDLAGKVNEMQKQQAAAKATFAMMENSIPGFKESLAYNALKQQVEAGSVGPQNLAQNAQLAEYGVKRQEEKETASGIAQTLKTTHPDVYQQLVGSGVDPQSMKATALQSMISSADARKNRQATIDAAAPTKDLLNEARRQNLQTKQEETDAFVTTKPKVVERMNADLARFEKETLLTPEQKSAARSYVIQAEGATSPTVLNSANSLFNKISDTAYIHEAQLKDKDRKSFEFMFKNVKADQDDVFKADSAVDPVTGKRALIGYETVKPAAIEGDPTSIAIKGKPYKMEVGPQHIASQDFVEMTFNSPASRGRYIERLKTLFEGTERLNKAAKKLGEPPTNYMHYIETGPNKLYLYSINGGVEFK